MKLKKLISQIIKFGIVGIIATLADIAMLMFLKEFLKTDVILASAVSFTISIVINYILSMRFVFDSKEENKPKEFIIFTILSLIGLCINQLVMWLGVKVILLHYLIVKVFAVIFVMVYNFVTRKIFLERKN